MGVGEFLAGLLQGSGLRYLVKINRAYYQQSLILFTACRYIPIPEPSQTGRETQQEKDLQILFKSIEHALHAGATRSDNAATAFELADRQLQNYIKAYNVYLDKKEGRRGIVQPDAMRNAAKQDQIATKHLTEITTLVEKKLKELKTVPQLEVPMQFWFDNPIRFTNLKPTYNSHRVDEVKIEETASLGMLLHRLMEFTSLYDSGNDSQKLWKKVRLVQYPQFYAVFPAKKETFDSAARDMEDKDGQKTRRISSLEPWRKVKDVTNSRTKGNPLHLIMDRKPEDGRTVHLKDGSVVILTDDYRNGWPLEDSEAIIVARRRTYSYSLVILQSGTSSTATVSTNVNKMPIPRLAPNPAAQAPVLHYPAYVPGSDAYSVASSSTLVGTASASSLTVTMPTPELAPLPQQPKKAPIYPTPIPGVRQPTNSIPSKLPAGGNPSNPAELSGAVIAADPPTSIRSHATVEQVNEEEDNSDNEGADGGVALPSYRGGVVHSTGSIGVTQVAAKKKKKRGLWGFFTGW